MYKAFVTNFWPYRRRTKKWLQFSVDCKKWFDFIMVCLSPPRILAPPPKRYRYGNWSSSNWIDRTLFHRYEQWTDSVSSILFADCRTPKSMKSNYSRFCITRTAGDQRKCSRYTDRCFFNGKTKEKCERVNNSSYNCSSYAELAVPTRFSQDFLIPRGIHVSDLLRLMSLIILRLSSIQKVNKQIMSFEEIVENCSCYA